MKLKDLTRKHFIIVTSQADYDKVKEILDTECKSEMLSGFRGDEYFGFYLFEVNIYSDGYSTTPQKYTIVPAADFISSNTITDHSNPVYGC